MLINTNSSSSRYQIIKELGQGTSSKVYKARENVLGQYVALKVLNQSEHQSLFETEKESLNSLRQCDGVVKIISTGRDTFNGVESSFIALEYIEGAELIDFLMCGGALKQSIAKHIFKQLVKTTKQFHDLGLVHRDIKSDNIMISSGCQMKMLDFGFSAKIQGQLDNGYFTTRLGTPGYMAPEIELGQAYRGTEVDTFALGVILFQLVLGRPPFKQAHPSDPLYKCLASNRADIFWRMHSRSLAGSNIVLGDDFKDLIAGMLSLLPNARPTLEQVLAHSWITAQQEQQVDLEELEDVYSERMTLLKGQTDN